MWHPNTTTNQQSSVQNSQRNDDWMKFGTTVLKVSEGWVLQCIRRFFLASPDILIFSPDIWLDVIGSPFRTFLIFGGLAQHVRCTSCRLVFRPNLKFRVFVSYWYWYWLLVILTSDNLTCVECLFGKWNLCVFSQCVFPPMVLSMYGN